FAVIGEEFGLICSAVVIGMFVALGIILIRIMNRSQDLWAKFVVGGVFAWLIFQALVNIAVVLSLLPVLGVTLPMISSGGSSLIANLMAIGVVLAIERRNSGTDAPMRRTQKRRPQKARR
ncbi:MAG: FtsW/RodA/SpoVE family cell cycle protein, partial [Micrococcales bacterium]